MNPNTTLGFARRKDHTQVLYVLQEWSKFDISNFETKNAPP